MNMIRIFLDQLLGRTGLKLIPAWRLERLHQAQHLKRILLSSAADLIVDVGANNGQFRDYLRDEVGYTGWIASFEPTPAVFEQLDLRANHDPLWLVFPYALGAESGSAIFNISGHSTLNSLSAPRFDQSDHAGKNRKTVTTVTVQVDTLDNVYKQILSRTACSRPYIKTDTQGYDLHVLRGASEVLRSAVGVQFEASVIPLYQDSAPYGEIIRFLEVRGFSLSDMYSVAHNGHGELIEFDCLMVRRETISDY